MTEKKYVPSPQQQAVFDWVGNSRGNAFIEAVAGAGKTTTLIKACQQMDGSVAFAAYNKKIADDIKAKLREVEEQTGERISNRVKAGTFHSFGLGAWRRAYKDVQVNAELKRQRMLLECGVEEKLEGFVAGLVSHAKQSGVGLLWNMRSEDHWLDIIDKHDMGEDLEEPNDIGNGIEAARRCVAWSREQGGRLIDFDDMIWLPAVSDIRIWQNDWVLVDEAQDTNPVRRVLARKMMRPRGRVVFVGDRHQAIYGFTGADNDAVDRIISEFGCESLPLTITYRCPKSIVAEAQKEVSHIEAHPSAPEGLVSKMGLEAFAKDLIKTKALTPADAILCRNTKPLVTLAFKIIKGGIACRIEGREIGQGLIKLVKRYRSKTLTALLDRLEEFKEKQVAKFMAKGQEAKAEALSDQVETIAIIAEGCESIDELVQKILNMFTDTETGEERQVLTLSTVHKAKGREWDRVFILEKSKHMPSKWARQKWQKVQEGNLIYVAVTRAKEHLVYLG